MASDNKARYTLRTTQELLDKFGYVAGYYGRTKNKELELLMKRRIADYEKKHEKIPEEFYKHDDDEQE